MKLSAESRRRILPTLLLLFGAASVWPWSAGADSGQAGYVKRASWAETMLAAREAVARELAGAPQKLGPWYTSGPLASSRFSEALFPEQGVDLQARSPDGQPRWCPRPEWADGLVHMLDGSSRVANPKVKPMTAAVVVNFEQQPILARLQRQRHPILVGRRSARHVLRQQLLAVQPQLAAVVAA